MMPRVVTAETLDGLAADDPAALRSRRDLQRIHRAMGTRGIIVRALAALTAARPSDAPLRILELGAGDGSLMLGVARQRRHRWPKTELVLLDRQNLLNRETVGRYADAGWTAAPQVMDVFDWVRSTDHESAASRASAPWDVIVATLFLHHFEDATLARLLAAVESRTQHFLACEPRRAQLALAASHLVGLLGANAVTREDAVLSVKAGFRGTDISALWPGRSADWTLTESAAGLFSHCFCASRTRQEAVAAP